MRGPRRRRSRGGLPLQRLGPICAVVAALISVSVLANDDRLEIVGFDLAGRRPVHRLSIDTIDVLLTSDGGRLLPLRRLLDALQTPNELADDVLRFAPPQTGQLVIDLEKQIVRSGEVTKQIELIRAESEIQGREEIYVSPDVLAELLSLQIAWDDNQYAFEAQTNRTWPVWGWTEGRSLFEIPVRQADTRLPELLPAARPRGTSVDFAEIRTRFNSTTNNQNSIEGVDVSQLLGSLWGSLGGGNYHLRLLHSGNRSAETPVVVVDQLLWNYRRARQEVAVGDAVVGFSGLTMPSVRLTGVRYSGLTGSLGSPGRRGSGAIGQGSFEKPRAFDGKAPIGSKVELVIDGQTVDTQEILPDVSSPTGSGSYRFDNILLRQGQMNEIRIVITEPDGSIRETRDMVVETPTLAPKGTMSFVTGGGTRRNRQTQEMNGALGGFRGLWGLTNRFTIGVTAGAQSEFYRGLRDTAVPGFRAFPDRSTHGGLQFSVMAHRRLMINAEASTSRGEYDSAQARIDGNAYRFGADIFVTRRILLRPQLFHYDQGFFNGQNVDVHDRQGGVLELRAPIGRHSRFDWAAGHIRNNVEDLLPVTDETPWFHVGFASRIGRYFSFNASFDRVDPSWEADPKNTFSLQFRVSSPFGLEVTANLFNADLFDRARLSRLITGFNLPGVFAFRSDSKLIRLRQRIARRQWVGGTYLNNNLKQRPTIFTSLTFGRRRPVFLRAEIGYDDFRGTAFLRNLRFDYSDFNLDFALDPQSRSRLGLNARNERGVWRTSLLFSLMTSFHGTHTKVVQGRITPGVGGIHGRVFIDGNGNGTRENKEPGIAGIRVRMDGRQSAVTDRAGYYQFAASQNPAANIALDLESVPAIYSPSHGRQIAYLQRGTMTRVNLGIVPLITASGTVLRATADGRQLPVSGVRVFLTDSAGNDVGIESFTAGDGSFYLEQLKPGNFRIVLDPASLPPDLVPAEQSPELAIATGTEPVDLDAGALLLVDRR